LCTKADLEISGNSSERSLIVNLRLPLTKTYLSSLAANFFAEGIEKLVSRYDKCLNPFGDYVEK
jgi:hypothetical protein